MLFRGGRHLKHERVDPASSWASAELVPGFFLLDSSPGGDSSLEKEGLQEPTFCVCSLSCSKQNSELLMIPPLRDVDGTPAVLCAAETTKLAMDSTVSVGSPAFYSQVHSLLCRALLWSVY